MQANIQPNIYDFMAKQPSAKVVWSQNLYTVYKFNSPEHKEAETEDGWH